MSHEPISTYRLQFQAGFGFDEATEMIDYLADLGISHVYSSPYLQAAPGSTHGYDVVDPTKVNEELGGTKAHEIFCKKLQDLGLGQIIDVVPNHMAIIGENNPWWWDVLKNGLSSQYAIFFDVDWDSSEERWPNKVLLPVLGNHYGRILENKEIMLQHQEGVFVLKYQDHTFPVDSSSLVSLLSRAAEACKSDILAFLAESHARLPSATVTDRKAVNKRHRDKAILQHLLSRLCLEDAKVNQAIDEEVTRINSSPDALDALIEMQNYRLAFWKAASRDLGYRRFFDVKDLAGLRVENLEVFFAIHALPMAWMEKGWIQGLRIDHPDGLKDPNEYFVRLRDNFPNAWIVAEKILMPGEKLPTNWPIAGTTGYDFIFTSNNLFIDPKGELALTKIYEEFTNQSIDFQGIARACKHLVLTDLLGSELNQLTSLFINICEHHRRHRDYSRHELHEALRETVVAFPVYRTYISPFIQFPREEDENYISQAIEDAANARKDLDPEIFNFLKKILLLQIPGNLEAELALRFQQLTGPTMAKGVEDTAFYRFNRLISLNEVGGDPSRFGISPIEFHQDCQVRMADSSLSMLASSTHDTKRSEDIRARLALLSEMPKEWEQSVKIWAEHNKIYHQGDILDANTEYLLYQTLVGTWPIDQDRIIEYMLKAVHEAKFKTSWTAPNETYENALKKFIENMFSDETFKDSLNNFVNKLIAPGWINSLALNLLKLTAPGVPDIYQGTELWTFNLVDPDNRRLVDYQLRKSLLAEVCALPVEQILEGFNEGLPKLWVIKQALHLRREHPDWFGTNGSYKAIYAQGPKADHLVAFMRGEKAITIVPRLVLGLEGNWDKTSLDLPEGDWQNILSGEKISGGTNQVQNLFEKFPVTLLKKL